MLTSPLFWSFLLAALLFAPRLPRFLRWSLIGGLTICIALMVPAGANALVGAVESAAFHAEACVPRDPATIVVLGAGLERRPKAEDDFSALTSENIPRLLAGVKLWQQSPGAQLVLPGGGRFAIKESHLLSQLAQRLGVSAQSIRTEEVSTTTWESAAELKALQPPLPHQFFLVSSALHLPRAFIAFRHFGFEPCAVISDSAYLPAEDVAYFLPQSSAVDKTEAALHEVGGLIVYRWRTLLAPEK
ncbi:MAG: YdcF family protein [Rudaea sp.]